MHPSSFGKRIPPPSRLCSKTRPPPSKSCLATSCSDRESSPSGETRVRKTVHFPDDEVSLERIRIIPPREKRKSPIFKRGRIAKTKSFIMYTSDSLGSNQRFLYRLPGCHGPRYTMYSHWMSVIRARRLAAAYCSQPRSLRSAPSSNGSSPEPATDGSLHDVFDMSSLKDALPEPASAGSSHGSAFNISSMLHALHDPDPTFNMTSLMNALSDPNAASSVCSLKSAVLEPAPAGSPPGFAPNTSSLMRALPGPDASSDVSSLAHVPKSMGASHSRKSHKVRPVAGGSRPCTLNRSNVAVCEYVEGSKTCVGFTPFFFKVAGERRRCKSYQTLVNVCENAEGSRTYVGFMLFSPRPQGTSLFVIARKAAERVLVGGYLHHELNRLNGKSLAVSVRKATGRVVASFFPFKASGGGFGNVSVCERAEGSRTGELRRTSLSVNVRKAAGRVVPRLFDEMMPGGVLLPLSSLLSSCVLARRGA
ncbi:hypothetical protein PENCOP_c002G07480 [Penicillium coprophilum]|uniref:Uncharacterized protein n=1 Tax=Penicillium coprophilum TaxID=36646 RepID=A0A1V6V2A6_9EURO|nr:hypothetical protein PENCOP_c002G07480 [Penicillium coprophilum]